MIDITTFLRKEGYDLPSILDITSRPFETDQPTETPEEIDRQSPHPQAKS